MYQNPVKESEAVSVVTSLLQQIEPMLAESSCQKQMMWSNPLAVPQPPKYVEWRQVRMILFGLLMNISKK